eukprot:scaffold126397_cov16-Tisochrysis_lutea.AAC.1
MTQPLHPLTLRSRPASMPRHANWDSARCVCSGSSSRSLVCSIISAAIGTTHTSSVACNPAYTGRPCPEPGPTHAHLLQEAGRECRHA